MRVSTGDAWELAPETTEVMSTMRNKVLAGIVAGLVAGVLFGFMMQLMSAPMPDGRAVPMMAMVAQVVRSDSLAVGWLYHLFNSGLIGGIYGWLLGNRVAGRLGAGAGSGALYGIIWWILGGLILMPIFLGMPAFSPPNAAGRDGEPDGPPALRPRARDHLRMASRASHRLDFGGHPPHNLNRSREPVSEHQVGP